MDWLRNRPLLAEFGEDGVTRRVIDVESQPANRQRVRHARADTKLQCLASGDAVLDRICVKAGHIEGPMFRDSFATRQARRCAGGQRKI